MPITTLPIVGDIELVTDRTQADVDRVKELANIGWASMTDSERQEWILGPDREIVWLDGEVMQCRDGIITAFVESGTNPGSYNYHDLNRVETVVAYLPGLLDALPGELKQYAKDQGVAWEAIYDVPYAASSYAGIVTKTDWTVTDIPPETQMARYLANVVKLRNVLEYATDDLPESMDKLDYAGANAIERALWGLQIALDELRERTEEIIDRVAAAWYFSGDLFAGEV